MNLSNEWTTLVVVNTLCIGLGLVCSYLCRRHAARAYQILWLSLISALLLPVLSLTVKQQNWGLLPANPESTATAAQLSPLPTIDKPENKPSKAKSEVSQDSAQTTAFNALTQETVSPQQLWPWQQVLRWSWAVATSLLLLRLVMAFLRGVHLIKQAAPIHDLHVDLILHKCQTSLGMRRPIVLLQSNQITCPMVWCWSREIAIVVPKAFLQSKGSIDWSGIFCHELAHYKRKDHIHGLLVECLVCLLPWQPLMWWAKHRLVALSEETCDDWVMSCGHQEADYAESLLDMLPQRRMAFTPTIATHKDGLAQRVRRILARQCSNPRKGMVWSCIVMLIVLIGTLGIAFAQTRTPETVQKDASEYATGSIEGTLLDTNGNPVPKAMVRVFPSTLLWMDTGSDGSFDPIAYSTQWTADHKIDVLAQSPLTNEAKLIQFDAPVEKISITLEPACIVRGKVLDPNGQPKLWNPVLVSLVGRYPSPTPIFKGNTNGQGVFDVPALPFGQAYTLSILTDVYHAEPVSFTTQNLQQNIVDIGVIRMLSGKPIISDKQQTPWNNSFRQAYQLDESENLKFIRAPFIMERQNHIVNHDNHFFLEASMNSAGMSWIWNDSLNFIAGHGSNDFDLDSVLKQVIQLESYEYQIPEGMKKPHFPLGDWVCRAGLSKKERLRALETIIAKELGRSLRFERQIQNRDTLIATGEFNFQALPDALDANAIYLQKSKGDFSNKKGKTFVSLNEFLEAFGHLISMPLTDETTSTNVKPFHCIPTRIVWDGYRDRHQDYIEAELAYMLESLSRQTGLQFAIEPRPREVWVLTEASD